MGTPAVGLTGGRPSTIVVLAVLCATLLGPPDLAWCQGPSGHSEIELAGAECCRSTTSERTCLGPESRQQPAADPTRPSVTVDTCSDLLLGSPTGLHESERQVAPPALATPISAARADGAGATASSVARSAAPVTMQARDALRATVLTI
ncbi:MAG: hypothetical protein HY825_17185 [Acidobacteria bacterium]|nr:hypothetical protein [Acidobacteriota bacterium]